MKNGEERKRRTLTIVIIILMIFSILTTSIIKDDINSKFEEDDIHGSSIFDFFFNLIYLLFNYTSSCYSDGDLSYNLPIYYNYSYNYNSDNYSGNPDNIVETNDINNSNDSSNSDYTTYIDGNSSNSYSDDNGYTGNDSGSHNDIDDSSNNYDNSSSYDNSNSSNDSDNNTYNEDNNNSYDGNSDYTSNNIDDNSSSNSNNSSSYDDTNTSNENNSYDNSNNDSYSSDNNSSDDNSTDVDENNGSSNNNIDNSSHDNSSSDSSENTSDDGDNNCSNGSSDIPIIGTGRPDLVLYDVFVGGDRIYYRIGNSGSKTAECSITRLYINGEFISENYEERMIPGQMNTPSFNYQINSIENEGVIEIMVIIDARDTVNESNETNNILVRYYPDVSNNGDIDLAIDSIFLSGNQINYRIQNLGDERVMSSTTYIYVNGELVGVDQVGIMAGGQTNTEGFDYPWQNLGEGDVIRIVADGPNELLERDEMNNEKIYTII